MNLSIGLQVFSIRNEMKKDFWGTLEKVAEIGYKNIEFANHSAETDFGCGHNIDADILKYHLDNLGIKVIASHVGPLNQNNLDKVMEYNAAIGNKAIVCSIGFYKNKNEVIEFSNGLNRIGEKCRKKGMDFYYHNHFMEFQRFDNKYAMDIILENTDKDYVKIELDTYWAIRGGVDPIQYLRKLGERCDLIHQKDLPATVKPANIFDIVGKEAEITFESFLPFSKVDYFTEVAEGVIDIGAIIHEAKEIGAARYIIVEQDHSSRSELDSIELSFKNLSMLLNA